MAQDTTPLPNTVVAAATSANAANAATAPDSHELSFDVFDVGASGFTDRRNLGLIYVDKTGILANFIRLRSPIFIARPRRFGKSLLCSTLEELFANGTENFKGLAIERLWEEWGEPKYPVIKIRFANTNVKADNSNLYEETFSAIVRQLNSSYLPQRLKEANIDLEALERAHENDLIGLIDDIVRQYKQTQADRRCVIIIDEYDAILNEVINDQDSFYQRLSWFYKFYIIIKGLIEDQCLRFIFLTGITRYAHTDTRSGFNNLIDLTFDSRVSALFGYTEEELRQYFWPYITYGAKLFGITPEEYLSLLRDKYDGYRFADKATAPRVYNPWSIMSSFMALGTSSGEDEIDIEDSDVFDNYWADSGVISNYFVKSFKKQLQNVQVADTQTQNDLLEFMGSDLTANFSVAKNMFATARNPYTMFEGKNILPEFKVAMVQSGYYTIRVPDKSERNAVNKDLGCKQLFFTVPNAEVAQSLKDTFWPQIKSFIYQRIGCILVQRSPNSQYRYLIDDLLTGDPAKMFELLNKHFVPLSKKSHVFDDEDSVCRFLVEIMYAVKEAYDAQSESKLSGSASGISSIQKEVESPNGYADIFIQGLPKNVVLELKLHRVGRSSCDTLLEEAITQIPTRRYCDQHGIKDTVCYAVVFSQETRRVEKLAVFHYLWLTRTYTQPQDKDLQNLDLDIIEAPTV